MLESFPPTQSGVNPLELIEIVERVVKHLDFESLVSVRTVSHLWYKLAQELLCPQSIARWDEFQAEDKLADVAANLHKTRVLTIDSKFYPGKALWSIPQREARKVLYDPLLKAMCNPDKNRLLEEVVFRGGMSAEEDLFPTLPNMSNLKRLTIEPHPENTIADRAGLLRILGTRPGGPGDSLEELIIRYGRWHSTGSPYKANSARSRLNKLVLDRVNMMDGNVTNVLQSCPELEELVAIRTLKRWAIPIMKGMSTSCPKLKRLTFDNGLPWDMAQMGWLTRFFEPELEALTIYGYDDQKLEEMLKMLGARFKQLETLSLHQCQGTRTPKEIGLQLIEFLAESSQNLHHLCVPDAELSLGQLLEDGRMLASRDMLTLDIGFDSTSNSTDGVNSRHITEFLADQWPKLRYVTLRLPRLDPAQDLRALKRLKNLVRLRLVVEELGPIVAAKSELKTFVFGKPGVWPLLSRFEIVYRHSQEETSSIQELEAWFQQEARPLVTFKFIHERHHS
ncbi:hypothetical protein BGW41_003946 [Actinomortierella wolfii]|nr:hypothetical protein BGW41_003946 [Actinomortierella wolfii]